MKTGLLSALDQGQSSQGQARHLLHPCALGRPGTSTKPECASESPTQGPDEGSEWVSRRPFPASLVPPRGPSQPKTSSPSHRSHSPLAISWTVISFQPLVGSPSPTLHQWVN